MKNFQKHNNKIPKCSKKNVMLNFELIYKFSGRVFKALSDVSNQKKALINKIWIIFNPIGKFFTVAYKVPHFEMIRLYLNTSILLHFPFFHLSH